jgi:branched-chain amino acid transport system permease protein
VTDTSSIEPTAAAAPAVANVTRTTPSGGGVTRARLIRAVAGAVAAVVLVTLPYNNDAEMNKVFAQAIFLAIAAMGLNLLTGYNGQVSIGHGAFFGIGAFTSAILVVDHGWNFEATIPLAAALAGIVGMLVGFPALRVRGLYLALITLGLAVLFPRLGAKYIDGAGGVALLRPKRSNFSSPFPGLNLDPDQYQYFVCLLVAVLMFVLARNLIRSRIGRAMVAVRDQELAAATVGVNLAGVKVGTFALSAAYAGVAGSLSVMVNKVADSTSPIVYFQLSIEFLVAVVIGGSATIFGPAIGAIVLTFLRRYTDDAIEGKEILSPAILGAALIAIVFILPNGIVGGLRQISSRITRRRASSDVTPGSDPGASGTRPLPEPPAT